MDRLHVSCKGVLHCSYSTNLGVFDRNGIFVSNNKRKGDLFYVPCYFGNGMIIFSCILQYLLLKQMEPSTYGKALNSKLHHAVCLTNCWIFFRYVVQSGRLVVFVPPSGGITQVRTSSFGMELGDVPRCTFQRVVEVISYENNSTHVSKIFIFILY